MKLKDLNIQYLNCPFCGSDDIEIMYDDGYNVGCLNCSTYVAPFLGADADSKQKHIDFWNTRSIIKTEIKL
jgi:transcription elongation factor Elf1